MSENYILFSQFYSLAGCFTFHYVLHSNYQRFHPGNTEKYFESMKFVKSCINFFHIPLLIYIYIFESFISIMKLEKNGVSSGCFKWFKFLYQRYIIISYMLQLSPTLIMVSYDNHHIRVSKLPQRRNHFQDDKIQRNIFVTNSWKKK